MSKYDEQVDLDSDRVSEVGMYSEAFGAGSQ
jgi:hypothetical protein